MYAGNACCNENDLINVLEVYEFPLRKLYPGCDYRLENIPGFFGQPHPSEFHTFLWMVGR